tara:strand:+ start:3 stop:1517 length:1515 start_codon:yes stop_codon:yes gene_type:complete
MDGQTKQKRVLNEADTVIRNVRAKQQVSINTAGLRGSNQNKNFVSGKELSTAFHAISTPANSDTGFLCIDSKGLFRDHLDVFAGNHIHTNGICLTNHDAPKQLNNGHDENWEKANIIFNSTDTGSKFIMCFSYPSSNMPTFGTTNREFLIAEWIASIGKFQTDLGDMNTHNNVKIWGDLDITGNYYKDGYLFGGGSGSPTGNTFVGLDDTPAAFAASKFLAVNSSATALEFVDAPSGGGGGGGGGSSTETDYLSIGDVSTRMSALHIVSEQSNSTKAPIILELDKTGYAEAWNGIILKKTGNDQEVRIYSDYTSYDWSNPYPAAGGMGGDQNFLINFNGHTWGVLETSVILNAKRNGTVTYVYINDEIQSGINFLYGDVRYTGALQNISDGRFKKNQQEVNYQDCYNKIKQLKLKQYDWDIEKLKEHSPKIKMPHPDNELGFIAQEVEEIIPDAVNADKIFNIPDFKFVEYNKINLHLFGAVRQLINDNELMKTRIEELEKLIG